MRSLLIRFSAACLPLAAMAGATSAQAEAFAAVSAGLSSQQLVCAAAAPCDDKASALRAAGGWRFNDRFSLEAAWLRGTPDFTASDSLASLTWNGRVAMESISASAAFDLKLGSLAMQFRAGVASVRGRFDSATTGVPDSSATEVRPILGIGLRQSFAEHWALRADLDVTEGQAYTRRGRFSVFTVGVERRF
jgi:hypothetical protein